jgi:hypothetical protein
MPTPHSDDDQYAGVLEALADISQQARDHEAKIESNWQIHRSTVNAAINLLSSELIRLQHIFDQFIAERKSEREIDTVSRDKERGIAHVFRLSILIAIVALIVINLFVLIYLIGRLSR